MNLATKAIRFLETLKILDGPKAEYDLKLVSFQLQFDKVNYVPMKVAN